MASIYAMAIAVSVFVTIIMLYTGFNAVDPDKIKLVRLFGASHRQVLWKIVLPASIPTMISTLKVNVGLALVGFESLERPTLPFFAVTLKSSALPHRRNQRRSARHADKRDQFLGRRWLHFPRQFDRVEH